MSSATIEVTASLSLNFDVQITGVDGQITVVEPKIQIRQPEVQQKPTAKPKKKQRSREEWGQLDLLTQPARDVTHELFVQEVLFALDANAIEATDNRKKEKPEDLESPILDKKPKASPGTSAGGPTSATITPQTAGEQQLQIRATSSRNSALMDLDEQFGLFRARDAFVDRAEAGKVTITRWELNKARSNRDKLREAAKAALGKACGDCAVATTCGIRGNFGAWTRIHRFASSQSQKRHVKEYGSGAEVQPGMETREAWRRRLMQDVEAPCLPPAKE